MPIGKNSIKRVVNSGYSKVKADCPDMENSTVLTNPSPEVIEVLVPSAKPKTKPTAKKAAPKAPAKKCTQKKAAEKVAASEKNNAFLRVEFGEELPIYLL